MSNYRRLDRDKYVTRTRYEKVLAERDELKKLVKSLQDKYEPKVKEDNQKAHNLEELKGLEFQGIKLEPISNTLQNFSSYKKYKINDTYDYVKISVKHIKENGEVDLELACDSIATQLAHKGYCYD